MHCSLGFDHFPQGDGFFLEEAGSSKKESKKKKRKNKRAETSEDAGGGADAAARMAGEEGDVSRGPLIFRLLLYVILRM